MNLFLFITSETYKKSSILGLKGFSSRNTVNFQILKRNGKWTKFVARNVGFLAFIVSLRYVPHILPYRASRSGNSLENQGHKQHWPSRLKLTFIHVGTNFHVDQCPFQKTLLITTFLDNSGAKNSYSQTRPDRLTKDIKTLAPKILNLLTYISFYLRLLESKKCNAITFYLPWE